jgi:hypothetical protein
MEGLRYTQMVKLRNNTMSNLANSNRYYPELAPSYTAFPPAPGFSPIPSLVRYAADTAFEVKRQYNTARRMDAMFEFNQKQAMAHDMSRQLFYYKQGVDQGFIDPAVYECLKQELIEVLKNS